MSIEIRPVRKRSDMRRFIDFPWRIYAGNSCWAPPIKSELSRLLDSSCHPFWQTGSRELFLALRNGEVVGRIAAIIDNKHNEFQGEHMGAWGFFECLPNPEASVKLIAAAEDWCRERGMQFMRGPLNPSTNYEIGFLLEGFDKPAVFMMPYTPPYYHELVRLCGYKKEKDLYSYRLNRGFIAPGWAFEVAARFGARDEIDVQTFSTKMEALQALGQLCDLYNHCWETNWGFSPISGPEIEEMARGLFDIIDPNLMFFVHHCKRPVGVALLVPDVNPFLHRLNGSLGLSALVKKYRHFAHDLRGIRGLLFGVLKDYWQMGIPLVAFGTMVGIWESNLQYEYIELGWSLEDNHGINNLFEEGGIKPDKKYRVYRKDLL